MAESALKVEPSGVFSLIERLSTRGFHEWTDTEQGRNEIGFYLETKQC